MGPDLIQLANGLRRAARRRLTAAQPLTPIDPAAWDLEVDDQGGLRWEGVALRDIVATYGSPIEVLSPRRVVENAQRMVACWRGCDARHSVHFSYKTTPVPAVLRLLHEAGVGAEVISEHELELALHLGVPGDRIVYTGPAKSDRSLELAIREGVMLIHVNHREEVARVARAAAKVGRTANVGVRVTAEHGWHGKFGESISEGRALETCREVHETPGLALKGLHLHTGRIYSDGDARRNVVAAAGFCADVKQALGVDLEYVDLGGGITVPTLRNITLEEKHDNELTKHDIPRPDVAGHYGAGQFFHDTHTFAEQEFAARGLPLPVLVFEPGIGLTGDVQLLLTSVVDTKRNRDEQFLITDAGINISNGFSGELHEIFPIEGTRRPATTPHSVVGPVCAPWDTVRHTWWGPEMQIGDTLAVMDTAAYQTPWTRPLSFRHPGIVAVQDGQSWWVRRAETIDHLTALDSAGEPTTHHN